MRCSIMRKRRKFILLQCCLFLFLLALLKFLGGRNNYAETRLYKKMSISYEEEFSDIFSFDHSPGPRNENVVCRQTPNVSYDYSMNEVLNEVMSAEETFFQSGTGARLSEKRDPESILDVIIIPTSHNDPGWLFTLDEYYNKKTKHILTNIVRYLSRYPDMTMVWPEAVFLERFWNESSETLRADLKHLVKSGRLEIICGGWVSPDEATTHYYAILGQLIEGHIWIKKYLDIKPKNCFSLDQFGYSMTFPYIWSKAGIQNIGVQRITKKVKKYMISNAMLDFIWRQQWDSSGQYDVFCHVEPYKWFTTSDNCGPNPNICKSLYYLENTDHTNESLSINTIHLVLEQIKQKAALYNQETVVVALGGDFAYATENEWITQYHKVSKMMNIVNENSEVFGARMRFGTFNDYFNTVKIKGKQKTIIGDLFTYSENEHDYWTGYYSTRPFDKKIGRTLMEFVRAAEVLTTLALLHALANNYTFKRLSYVAESLQMAQRNLALFQHHDAITGTSTAETTIDYRTRLFLANKELQNVMAYNLESIISNLHGENINIFPVSFQVAYDSLLSSRVVNVKKRGTNILVWNPLPRDRLEIICIRLDRPNVRVSDRINKTVTIQINPMWYNGSLSNISEACFEISIESLSFDIYTVTESDTEYINNVAKVHVFNPREQNDDQFIHTAFEKSFTIQNDFLSLTFSNNGTLTKFCTKEMIFRTCLDVQLDWILYDKYAGDAYIYRPNLHAITLLNISDIRVIFGPLVTKVIYNHSLFQQVLVLYNTTGIQGQYLEIENVATLLKDRQDGKELLLRFHTSVVNKDYSYFTDANGLQMVKRHFRPKMPPGSNIYPMTTMMFIEDMRSRLSLHSAQPLGVGSFDTGSFQILIDRRPSMSGEGLTEAVLDNRPALSKFFLQLERNRYRNKREDSDDISFPSVLSTLVNDILQHPFQLFLSENFPTTMMVKPVKLFKNEFPVDLVLAGVKTFYTSEHCWNGLGLTFHRRWVPCEHVNNYSYNSKLSFSNLFELIRPQTILKSDLTFTDVEENIPLETMIHISSMDLASYHFSWNQCRTNTI